MALPGDASLMDMLFDRDDPVLKMMNDKEIFKGDNLLSCKLESWANDDAIIEDILKNNDIDARLDAFDENFNLDYQTSEIWDPDIKSEPAALSDGYSDSGYSNGQLSPGLNPDLDFSPRRDDDDDQTSSTISTTSDSSLNHHQVEEEVPVETRCEPPRKKARQVVKVSPMLADNPRSVLLPVNTTNGVRTFKIVSPPGGLKTIKPLAPGTQVVIKSVRANGSAVPVIARRQITALKRVRCSRRPMSLPASNADSDDEIHVVSDDEDPCIYDRQQYPRLQLSPEERKLMQKEGVTLPTHYPLTKIEERELKRIRRKIRNKISAQDSRKRKKEYLDGLEDRVRQCTQENMSLVRKIKFLQSHNQSLIAQVKKLQTTLASRTAKTAQPATCLLVILLSVVLVLAPNIRLTPNESDHAEQDAAALAEKTLAPIAGRTRNLLSSEGAIEDELLSLGSEQELPFELHDLLRFNSNDVSSDSESSSSSKSSMSWADAPHFLADHDYGPSRPKRRLVNVEDKLAYAPVDSVWPPPKIDHVVKRNSLIMPDVDDEWLPKSSNLMETVSPTEVKVNISDGTGTRTVVIQVPKENK